MSLSSRRRWFVLLLIGGLGLAASGLLAPRAVAAQQVLVVGPTTNALTTVTPLLQLRALGLAEQRPLLVQLQISTTADFAQPVLDSSFVTNDTLAPIQITRPLPSEAYVFWRLKVRAANGIVYDSPTIGPRLVPPWLVLRTPNSAAGNSFDIRRPLFVWSAAPMVESAGPWTFDLEITSEIGAEAGVAGLRDTTFRPATDLKANTSYRWNVRATHRTGESIRVFSQGTFVITDPTLPTTTLFFQNFPNPFPSATSFSTCFWFDIGEPGAKVKLEVLDIRGNKVRSIVPGSDGISQFAAGRYGRGTPGSSSNCDNRFVWDGTADDGRTVAPGVYIARFTANNGAPIFRRILFADAEASAFADTQTDAQHEYSHAARFRMRLTTIGTGTAAPHAARVSAAHLVHAGDVQLLLDCGSGAVHRMAQLGLSWPTITHVALTHFHTDHIADLPQLIMGWRWGQLPPRAEPVTIFGPPGTGALLERMATVYGPALLAPGYPLTVREIGADEIIRLPGAVEMRTHAVPHTPESVAYSISEGTRRLVYTGDTGESEALGDWAANCDLLLAECSLPDTMAIREHLTPRQAGALAARARTARLVLTHLYPPVEAVDILGEVAEQYTGPCVCAHDGWFIDF